jgi:CBS domain-containing protein
MNVSAFMNSPPTVVPPEASARRTALCMEEDDVGSVLVVSGDSVLGIVTDRDLALRCLARRGGGPDTPVSELMSAALVTLNASDDIDTAYQAFRRSGVRRLPVLDSGRLVGMLTIDDLFLDAFQRLADLLGPVSWSVLRDPPDPAAQDRPG